jgi:hypothetical protein
MTDTNPRPLLANAHEAAEDYLMRKVAAGDVASDVAKDMVTTGFTVATRILSELRTRDGLSEDAITSAFQRRLDRARAVGDHQRVIAAEFTLAVWDGMQRDLAAYLNHPSVELADDRCQGHEDACMFNHCTGRESTCQCMCPVCLGERPEDYGYDGDW